MSPRNGASPSSPRGAWTRDVFSGHSTRALVAAGLAGLLLLAAACGGEPDAAARDGATVADTSAASAATGQAAGPERGEASGAEDADGRRLTTIDVAGYDVRVEIADDDAERRRGLMHRDSLPEDEGMLFVYPEEQTLSFWMRETVIPLDIAFVDRRGYIVDIQQMDPHTEELHESSSPAMYALELNRGWFEEHGVEEGDRVRF